MEHMDKNEPKDEILLETRRIKEELARSMDFDIGRILEDTRQKQRLSGRKAVPPPVRKTH